MTETSEDVAAENARLRDQIERLRPKRPKLTNYVKVNFHTRDNVVCFYSPNGSKWVTPISDESKVIFESLQAIYSDTVNSERDES